MAAERFYIYRCGKTETCAVTGAKGDSRLVATLCPASWQFWMQVTRHQAEDGCSGFTFDAAVEGIKAKGYFLFTGSPLLLGDRIRMSVSAGSSNG